MKDKGLHLGYEDRRIVYKIKIGPNVCKCCNLTIGLVPGRHRVIPPQISSFTCLFVTCVSERIKGSNESLHSTHFLTFETDKIELSNSYHLSSPRIPKALYELSEQMEKINQVHFRMAQSMQLHTHSQQMGNSDKPKSKFQDPTQLLILKSPVSCWGLTQINIPALSLQQHPNIFKTQHILLRAANCR